MKTPEQIADDVMEANHFRSYQTATGEEVAAWLTAAIEADRAQRETPRVSIFHPGSPDEVSDYALTVSDQIADGYTSGGVYGGSGIYWEGERL